MVGVWGNMNNQNWVRRMQAVRQTNPLGTNRKSIVRQLCPSEDDRSRSRVPNVTKTRVYFKHMPVVNTNKKEGLEYKRQTEEISQS